jgi:hypothetical protein
MFDFISKNQRGSVMVIGLVVATAIGVGITIYIKNMGKMSSTVKSFNSQKETLLAVSKLKTFGSYLVSSNAIICKEAPFAAQTEGYRCIWTGKQLVDGQVKSISEEKLGLFDQTYDKGFLSFKVDSSKFATPQDLKDMGVLSFKGAIGFKLYDAQTDSLNLASKLGRIPFNNLMVDNDRSVVLIKIDIEFSRTGSKNSANSQSLSEYFSLRRPIAIPELTFDIAACKKSCESATSRNDNPACRGDQNFKFSPEARILARTKNLGPGVLYNLVLQREVKIDKKLFPNSVEPAKKAISAMPGKDYLMPGEDVEWPDVVECLSKTETVKVIRQTSVNTGAVTCFVDNKQVDCAQFEDSANQHFSSGGKINYKIDVSPFDIQKYKLVKKSMNKTSPDGVLMSHVFKSDLSNSGNISIIEPARTASEIKVLEGDLPVKIDTETEIIEIATH